MILESVTILYYTLATISIGIVLYQKYNTKIHSFINKYLYNYEIVPNDTIDLCNINDSNNDTYILFNDNINQNSKTHMNNDYENTNLINNNEHNNNNNNEHTNLINNNEHMNNNNENNNENNNQEIKIFKTKKNIVIDFE